MSAALILMLVYFMAIGLASDTREGRFGASGVSRASLPPARSRTRQQTPTIDRGATTPTSVLAPTPTASATATEQPTNQFITQAVTATGVDSATSQALNPTTMFSVNQKVYVVLHLHPASQGGAVCLLWYLNGKETGQFEFAISVGETMAYSYTIYEQVGAGYVDVYWASTTGCGKKLLAQHIVFTVTA